MDPCGTQARLSKFASTSVLTFLPRERLSDVPLPISYEAPCQHSVKESADNFWLLLARVGELRQWLNTLEWNEEKKIVKEYGGLHRFHS